MPGSGSMKFWVLADALAFAGPAAARDASRI